MTQAEGRDCEVGAARVESKIVTELAAAARGERGWSCVRGRNALPAGRLSGIRIALGFTVCLWSWQAVVLPASGVAQCVGDCDGSGTVTVNELVEGVTIALGDRSLGDCASFDPNSFSGPWY